LRKDVLVLLFVLWKVLSFGTIDRGRTGRWRRVKGTLELVPATPTIMIHGEKV